MQSLLVSYDQAYIIISVLTDSGMESNLACGLSRPPKCWRASEKSVRGVVTSQPASTHICNITIIIGRCLTSTGKFVRDVKDDLTLICITDVIAIDNKM